jgi:hypothetical protein
MATSGDFEMAIDRRETSRRISDGRTCLDSHSIRRPLIALAMTKRCISDVPSKIV